MGAPSAGRELVNNLGRETLSQLVNPFVRTTLEPALEKRLNPTASAQSKASLRATGICHLEVVLGLGDGIRGFADQISWVVL